MATANKATHVGFRNGDLFCSHCGSSQKIPAPMEISVFAAMGKAFQKSHAKCRKTWTEPVVDQSISIERKAAFWLQHGERGMSSETMFGVISGLSLGHRASHPYDPDDFRRCYLLLKAVPEWREKLPMLRPVSKAWSNLVDHWDELTSMLEEMMAGKKSSAMYDLMQKLIA